MKENGRSTRAERLALPIWCATKRNPKRSAKASISGTGIISRPVPRSTTTCVLSVQQQSFGCAHRVERPFWFIENNFLAGRAFASWESESTGAPMVRPCQRDLQEIYPGRAAGTVRGRALAPETVAGVDSRSVPSASAHGRRGGICLGERHPLLGSGLLDRAEGGGARDSGQNRDRTGCAPPGHACPRRASAVTTDHPRRTSAAARGRRPTPRSAPRGTSPLTGRAGDRRVRDGVAAKRPQSGGAGPAATVAVAEGISAGAVPGRGPGSRTVWTLRSGPVGTHDSAPRGARLLSAVGHGLRSP